MERLRQISSHLSPSLPTGKALIELKKPDDVVIVLAVRSPLTKALKGTLKDTKSDELLTSMLKATVKKAESIGIPIRDHSKFKIGDICVGTVLPPEAAYEARASAIIAGIPIQTPVQVINRFCSSGLMAVTTISNQIRTGQIDIGLAVGVESMSTHDDKRPKFFSDEILSHEVACDCTKPMGWTSENVAEDFNISREEMDRWAAISFQRASKAQKTGLFKEEIVPIEGFFKTADIPLSRNSIIVEEDDGIRHGTTVESLLKIRSAFPQWGGGKTTGGNASQVTDGAAAVLLMRRSKADELGIKVIAKHVTTAVAGLPPRIMGIGPSIAIPKVLEMAGIKPEDVDLYEVNEAFASMMVYCIKKLNLPEDKVNVNGGAIALGHPLGATGARQIATGLAELRRRKQKVLVTSMCIGTGMGAAAVFVNEDL